MPVHLRVQLLGAFAVWRGDALVPPAEWRGQKTRNLLKILLLARGSYVSADRLIEYLWRDAAPEAADGNLRAAISELRRLLEPGLARGRDSAFIRTRREGYHFDLSAPVTVDLFELEQTTELRDPAALADTLSRLAGELLEEDPYAEWALPDRERLRQLRVEALARVSDHALSASDFPTAIDTAEKGLALDSGRELTWRLLMRAHHAIGDRAAALRAFDRFRTSLARELGADPSPETLALHQQILQAEPGAAASAAATRASTAASPPWLFRLAAAGLILWVLFTGLQLVLQLAGALQGGLVTSSDPGADALPFLSEHPAALGEWPQQIYGFIPLGLLLLPAYLAWFMALGMVPGSTAGVAGSSPTHAGAWLGLGLGLLDILAQTLSRALRLAQISVLPPAYAGASHEQRLVLVTLWDVLRQLAGSFAFFSDAAHPMAVALLCLATLAAVAPARQSLRWAQPVAWSGLGLAALTIAYTVPPLGAWGLPLGLALAAANYVWLLILAAALWR